MERWVFPCMFVSVFGHIRRHYGMGPYSGYGCVWTMIRTSVRVEIQGRYHWWRPSKWVRGIWDDVFISSRSCLAYLPQFICNLPFSDYTSRYISFHFALIDFQSRTSRYPPKWWRTRRTKYKQTDEDVLCRVKPIAIGIVYGVVIIEVIENETPLRRCSN